MLHKNWKKLATENVRYIDGNESVVETRAGTVSTVTEAALTKRKHELSLQVE